MFPAGYIHLLSLTRQHAVLFVDDPFLKKPDSSPAETDAPGNIFYAAAGREANCFIKKTDASISRPISEQFTCLSLSVTV